MLIKGVAQAQAARAILLVTSFQYCIAFPYGPAASRTATTLTLADPVSEPTCTTPENFGTFNASSPHLLGTFPRECIDTANYFFNFPMVAQIAWHWKLLRPGQPPQPGYNMLPFSAAPTGCMLTLDVLDDPDAEDQLALVQIADDFRALFNKCVRGRVHGPSAGFIPVGRRKVLKLSIGPTPMGGRHNLTAGGLSLGTSAEGRFHDSLES